MRPTLISLPSFVLTLLVMTHPMLPAQEKVTYWQHVRPILQQHCVTCHSPGEVGPFPLRTFDEVLSHAGFIAHVTRTRYMPPWKADTAFRHFANENVLSEQEIATIAAWVAGGKEEGAAPREPRKSKAVRRTMEPSGLPSIVNDRLRVSMRHAFPIPANNREEFRFFHVPLRNNDTLYVRSIRFIPGNRKLVHHARIMCDTSGLTEGIDGLSAEDPHSVDFQTKPLSDPFLYGWVPGNDRIQFPEGMVKKILPGTALILNIHYSPSQTSQTDSSSVEFELTGPEGKVELKTFTMTEELISNKPFRIAAEERKTFYMLSEPLLEDISLVTIMPHMHLLGKSFKAFSVLPAGDVAPLVHVPDWDFNWQMTYQYPSLLSIPKGSVIYATAEYDNTRSNPRNPNIPSRETGQGWGTKDEMMNLVIYYVPGLGRKP
ncbi:MAG: hypothetical protein FJX89_01445 [Bacteroidetes bacterium]|nr:hypothetical protein [Bacteroidota bacterium]